MSTCDCKHHKLIKNMDDTMYKKCVYQCNVNCACASWYGKIPIFHIPFLKLENNAYSTYYKLDDYFIGPVVHLEGKLYLETLNKRIQNFIDFTKKEGVILDYAHYFENDFILGCHTKSYIENILCKNKIYKNTKT